MCPLRFGLQWLGMYTTVLISVFATDGTIAVTHGGIEIGQGINTKVSLCVLRCFNRMLLSVVALYGLWHMSRLHKWLLRLWACHLTSSL